MIIIIIIIMNFTRKRSDMSTKAMQEPDPVLVLVASRAQLLWLFQLAESLNFWPHLASTAKKTCSRSCSLAPKRPAGERTSQLRVS